MNGRKGVWGHAIGGMGAITQAMAKAAVGYGVEIRLSVRVRQVLIENGRAIGVETDKGESIRARAVAAGINPKVLYSTSSMRAPCPKDSGEHHASGIIIAPSLAYMEQAYVNARSFGCSRRPIVELVIPSH